MVSALTIGLIASLVPASGQKLETVSVGDLKLQNGETIRDCRIAYRTVGKLDADRSNAVLFPTWFTGTSQDITPLLGPGKLLDTDKVYVIIVDALGNGMSSSPSNSATQPHMKFPKFGIRDMVESQHLLLTQKLGITHLRGVMGISMGGMQTFQWMVSYPDFMDYAVPIVGSTRLTSFDLLLWTAEEHAIQEDSSWNHGEYTETPEAMKTVGAIQALALSTPDYWLQNTPLDKFDDVVKNLETKSSNGFDSNNWIRQLQAMMGLDVSREFGGSMEKAAAAVRAKVLVVPSLQDHMVNPHPALDFAKLLRAETLLLDDNCGHMAPTCNQKRIGEAVNAFLTHGPK